jgi:putative transposase
MARGIIPRSMLNSLLETIRNTEDVDALRETTEWALQQLIEADVSEQIGAEKHERAEDRRLTQRNGYRHRTLNTRIGKVELGIPKLRKGTYYPDWLLERQQPAEKALLSVIMESYVNGVSTRKVERLAIEMGLESLDKSAVSRINKGLDDRVGSFLNRSLKGTEYPYIWLDATFPKVREDNRVQSTALVVAMGVRKDGVREILGISLGAAETEAFWMEFLRDLVARGLHGVRLVVSDAHQGLINAIQQVLGEAAWQRCQVHFMRNILSHAPKSAQPQVGNLVRTIFQQPTHQLAAAQLKRIVLELEGRFPKAAGILDSASVDLLSHMHFPPSHWRRIRSTNPLERLNREIRRRIDVVGIFPNRPATIRLTGAILLEQHEDWMTGKRYFSEQSMSKLYQPVTQKGPA